MEKTCNFQSTCFSFCVFGKLLHNNVLSCYMGHVLCNGIKILVVYNKELNPSSLIYYVTESNICNIKVTKTSEYYTHFLKKIL